MILDTHIRVGGAIGSNLQLANCPKLTGLVNPDCIAASLLVHITSKASAYFENNWFWVEDHVGYTILTDFTGKTC